MEMSKKFKTTDACLLNTGDVGIFHIYPGNILYLLRIKNAIVNRFSRKVILFDFHLRGIVLQVCDQFWEAWNFHPEVISGVTNTSVWLLNLHSFLSNLMASMEIQGDISHNNEAMFVLQ